jgi:hypothetical protein
MRKRWRPGGAAGRPLRLTAARGGGSLRERLKIEEQRRSMLKEPADSGLARDFATIP